MQNYFVYSIIASLSLLLVSCGGGGGSDSSSSSSSTTAPASTAPASTTPASTTPVSTINLATPAGTACTSSFSNTDAFGNIVFIASTGITSWGCLVVDKVNNQPTYAGTQSVRFEVRPGDCDATQTFISGSNLNASDCTTDRSRYEIREYLAGSTSGQVITYE